MILIMNDNYVKTCTPWLVFAHTAGVQQVFYYFNLSHTEVTDQILEAELRLFKLRPAPEVRRALRRRRARHLADVSAKSDSPRPHSAIAGCPLQGRLQKKNSKGVTEIKRRYRDTVGVYGDCGGCSLPSRLGDLGERRELPQPGPGRSPVIFLHPPWGVFTRHTMMDTPQHRQ